MSNARHNGSEHPSRKIVLSTGFLQLRQSDLVGHIYWLCKQSSQRNVAASLGISPAYLSDILNSRRDISAQLAEKLGFMRVITFVKYPDDLKEDAS